MPRSKPRTQKREPLPDNFDSLEALGMFWDTHSTADYEDLMEDVDMQVDIRSRRVYCAVAQDILTHIHTAARRQGVSPETLMNLWLREKAAEVAQR